MSCKKRGKMYALLSDIHGNMFAFQSVLEDMKQYNIEGIILLGDLIDYGMQSNEVITYLKDKLRYKIICNIWGNHEHSIMLEDFTKFSSQRSVESAKYTASLLSDETRTYLDTQFHKEGNYEFWLKRRKCLAVHGSLDDYYWKAISPENVQGEYNKYDFVFSGHSHYSHVFTKFYDVNALSLRNKHAVRFINPGSIGQPRNHNPRAQYALLDVETESVNLRAVTYEVEKAMAMYNGDIDMFYRDRLKIGV